MTKDEGPETKVRPVAPARHVRPWSFVFAAIHSLNGYGEMTGAPWLNEAGLLSTPIAITNTCSVVTAYEALLAIAHASHALPHRRLTENMEQHFG